MEESWKTTGDCETCRRKQYCKRSCSKHKEAFKQYIWDTMVERYGDEVTSKIDREAFIAGLMGAVRNGNVQTTDRDVQMAE